MSRQILVLAADEDDALRFAIGRPDLRSDHLTLAWPLGLERIGEKVFDRMFVTAAARSHPNIDRLIAACKTRIGRTVLTKGV